MKFRLLDRLIPSSRSQRRLQGIGGMVVYVVGYPFRLLIGLAKTIGQLVASWWDSRNLRFLLQGLPAFFMAIGVVVLGAVVFFQDRAALATEYELQGSRSLAESRQRLRAGQDAKASISMAEMCYNRLNGPTPKPENLFHMAEAYELSRNYAAALQIYELLAPLDPKKAGYGPAHYMVARRLLAMKPDSRTILEAENHLVQAEKYALVRNDRQEALYSALAQAALFDVLRDTNRPDEAEVELVHAVNYLGDQEPQLRLKLANWYWQTGKRDQSDEQIKRAIDTLTKRVDDNLNDLDARANLIECLKFAAQAKCARGDFKKGKEDFARSMGLVQRGMAMTTDPVLRQKYLGVMCYLLLAQFDATLNDPNTSYADRFGWIEAAMSIQPNNVNLIERLRVFMTNSGPETKKAQAAVQKMIDEGKHLSLGHMILGTAAWEKEDFATAQYHWERAFEQADWSPLVANNLAWLIGIVNKPPDPPRALMVINAALSRLDNPQFHGTKGAILLKMERYRDALEELEKAKPAYGNNPKEAYKFYKRLEEACSKLGMESDRKHYADLADQLLKAAQSPAGATMPNTKTPAAGAPAATAPPANAPPKP